MNMHCAHVSRCEDSVSAPARTGMYRQLCRGIVAAYCVDGQSLRDSFGVVTVSTEGPVAESP